MDRYCPKCGSTMRKTKFGFKYKCNPLCKEVDIFKSIEENLAMSHRQQPKTILETIANYFRGVK